MYASAFSACFTVVHLGLDIGIGGTTPDTSDNPVRARSLLAGPAGMAASGRPQGLDNPHASHNNIAQTNCKRMSAQALSLLCPVARRLSPVPPRGEQ